MKDAQLAKQHPAANSKAYWVRRLQLQRRPLHWRQPHHDLQRLFWEVQSWPAWRSTAGLTAQALTVSLRPPASFCCLAALPCPQVALSRLVLKRFLLLAALLDRAAQLPALPGGAPLLFRVGAKLKASTQVGSGLAQRGASWLACMQLPAPACCHAV